MMANEMKELSKISLRTTPNDTGAKKNGYKKQRLSPLSPQSTLMQPRWSNISTSQLEAFFDGIPALSYRQRVMIGNSGLVIEPKCSGYALGSSNWLLDFPMARRSVFYCGRSSVALGSSPCCPVADFDHRIRDGLVDVCLVGSQLVTSHSAVEEAASIASSAVCKTASEFAEQICKSILSLRSR
jgi:hypothetical protein